MPEALTFAWTKRRSSPCSIHVPWQDADYAKGILIVPTTVLALGVSPKIYSITSVCLCITFVALSVSTVIVHPPMTYSHILSDWIVCSGGCHENGKRTPRQSRQQSAHTLAKRLQYKLEAYFSYSLGLVFTTRRWVLETLLSYQCLDLSAQGCEDPLEIGQSRLNMTSHKFTAWLMSEDDQGFPPEVHLQTLPTPKLPKTSLFGRGGC